MTLKTQITADLSSFFNADEFAESVNYTPDGGDLVAITAIVMREGTHQETFIRGPETATATIMVKKTEVTTPQQGDLFTFDSQNWRPSPEIGTTYEDDDTHIIELVRVD